MTNIVKFNQASLITESRQLEQQAIASLPASIGSSIVERTNSDYEITGYTIDTDIDIDDLELARQTIMDQSQEPQLKDIAMGLAKLDALTARPGKTEMDIDLMIQAYSDKIREYPADAVIKALDTLADNHWFPTWAEIKAELDYLTRQRRAIIRELDRKIAKIKPSSSVAGLISGAIKK